MNNFALYLLLLIPFVGINCSFQSDKPPLEDNKIVNLLADVQILDKALPNKMDEAGVKLYTQYLENIYQIHDIDSVVHKNVIDYLQNDIKKYSEIQQKVHQRLKLLEKDLK